MQAADVLREVPISRTSLEQKFRKVLGRSPAAEIRCDHLPISGTKCHSGEGLACGGGPVV
jgi:hypothetical protein